MAFTTEQKANILYNRLIGGKSYTDNNLSLDEEQFKGRDGVTFDNVWVDSIPEDNPLESHSLYSNTGATHPLEDPIIKKWHKEPLKKVTTAAANRAFYYGDTFRDLIPSEFGNGKYQWQVWKKDVHGNYTVEVPYGQNNWYFDPTNGVLTFLGELPSGIDNGSNPPAITAYQYIGRKGSSNLLLGANASVSADSVDGITVFLNSNSKIEIKDKYKQAVYWSNNLSSTPSEIKSQYLVSHGLDSRQLSVDVYEKDGTEFSKVEVPWSTTSANQIVLNFSPNVRSDNFSLRIMATYN